MVYGLASIQVAGHFLIRPKARFPVAQPTQHIPVHRTIGYLDGEVCEADETPALYY